ncbi:MAG: hypothetical protein IJS39_02855 [Synergistaceae bacterium]|nr:hypothetical protein [Synergistaceae bacterium]
MPATIINVSAVEDSTSKALEHVRAQQDILEGINTTVNTMDGVWQSQAQREFADSFRQSRERIERFNESVIQSVNNMRSFVTECVSADELTAKEILGVSW